MKMTIRKKRIRNDRSKYIKKTVFNFLFEHYLYQQEPVKKTAQEWCTLLNDPTINSISFSVWASKNKNDDALIIKQEWGSTAQSPRIWSIKLK